MIVAGVLAAVVVLTTVICLCVLIGRYIDRLAGIDPRE